MLVNSRKLLKAAQKGHFAIPGANFADMESIKFHIFAAEEQGLPLILELAESHLGDNINLEDAALIGRKYAEQASVPVVLHLDHGESFETCKKAVDLGFTSVMIDASRETFDDNVAITGKVVEYAHAHGVVVEAEIGHVASNFNMSDTHTLYTTATEAAAFAAASGCDSLAVSIGTAHGAYKTGRIPKISFEALSEIRNAVDIPLVLHGGSGSGDDNLRRCAREGICKINVYTDLYASAMASAQKACAADYLSLRKALKQGMMDCLKHYYSVFETKPVAGF